MQRSTAIAMWLCISLHCLMQGEALPAAITDQHLDDAYEKQHESESRFRDASNEVEHWQQSTNAASAHQTSGNDELEDGEGSNESEAEYELPEKRLVVRDNKSWDEVISVLLMKDFSIMEICDNLKGLDPKIIRNTVCERLEDELAVRFEEGFGDFMNDKEIMREVDLLTETLPMCRNGFLLDGKYCRRMIIFKRAKKRSG